MKAETRKPCVRPESLTSWVFLAGWSILNRFPPVSGDFPAPPYLGGSRSLMWGPPLQSRNRRGFRLVRTPEERE